MNTSENRQRIVIKIGSSTLVDDQDRLDKTFLANLASQCAMLRDRGYDPVIVTSAAIACGVQTLQLPKRPTDMPTLQACASVGQNALTAAYRDAFAAEGMITSLVLITRRDTADRKSYLHARDTLTRLLSLGVVPIVNENDTVSVEQIRFGDNDTLAALVACLIESDLVIICSDVDGLFDQNPATHPEARLVSLVNTISPEIMDAAGSAGSKIGSGGMITKISAARVLMTAGIPMIIVQGRIPSVLVDIVDGKPHGTRFESSARAHKITAKKLWIALGDTTHGYVVIDDGAKAALLDSGKSLLYVGMASVAGDFDRGDVVDVKDRAGNVLARGIAGASHDEAQLACGLANDILRDNHLLAALADHPFIHRDELVIFS